MSRVFKEVEGLAVRVPKRIAVVVEVIGAGKRAASAAHGGCGAG